MNRKALTYQIVVSVATVLLIFFCVFWCGSIWGFSYPWYIVTGGLGFLFSWFAVAALHETGHLLAGLCAGFRVSAFKVFYFTAYRKEGKFTFAFDTKSGTAGACEMYPVKEENIEKNYLKLSAGGLVLTGIVFCALVALVIISGFFNLKPVVYPVFSFFVMWLPAAFFYTFFNMIPFENGDGKSDGFVIAGIRHMTASERTAINALKIQARMYRGQRPSEIDKDLYFSAPQLMETDPNFILITQLRYMYYSDLGDSAKAIGYINRLEGIYDEIPPAMKAEIAMDLLFEYSLKSEEYQKVDGYFYDCLNLLKRKNSCACRVMAAYELSFNRRQEAMECIEEALRLLPYEPMKGKADYEERAIAVLKKFV